LEGTLLYPFSWWCTKYGVENSHISNQGEDNSPAHFEKTLAALSTKINDTTARLDTHRQNARRFKALWTLYTTFAYLFYSIILALVLGWQNWGVVEYSAVSGGPVLYGTH
jgi:endoplasmic reticulum junction formation protein lunapark